MSSTFRKQIFHIHLTSLGAGLGHSIMYFLHCANFSYGAKLVEKGEMKFDQVFRYKAY